MASQNWLSKEVQSLTPQTSGSSSALGPPSMSPITSAVGNASAVGTTSKETTTFINESPQESAQKTLVAPPIYGAGRPSFSYMNANASSESTQQSSFGLGVHSGSPISVSVLQPPVTGQSTSGPSFSYNIAHGSGVSSSQQFPSRLPLAPGRPGHPGHGNTALSPDITLKHSAPPQPMLKSGTALQVAASSGPFPASVSQGASVSKGPEAIAPAPFVTQSVSQPAVPPLQVSQAMGRSPMAPGPVMSGAPLVPGQLGQPQAYGPYPSVPLMGAAQGPWLQPQPVAGIVTLPYSPFPSAYSGPFHMAGRGMAPPSAAWPDTHPPGVTPLRTPTGIPPSTLPSSQMTDHNHTSNVDKKESSSVSEKVDTWTAHRTETGAIYYYNALTGESTYEKPAGFRGEPDNVTAQPTPVSWEKLANTDWSLVTTNDGKRYYYNAKTKLSSWQIPTEVMELKKEEESAVLSEQFMPVTTTSMLTDGASGPVILNTPAINTGGRDAIPLRPSGVPGSSSALDLIKRKLQDSGTPATTSPGPSLPGASEANGSKTVDATVKGPVNENNRDKVKDATNDGNMSESSSDSEDEEKGLSTEECIIQFKEMLKERGVAPFSKWEKELPKILFDPRFKAIPSHSARRALFEHYVRTRAEEERKEKRAAQKAALEGFKQLLDEAKQDIDHNTNYQTFKKKWGNDPRFEALDRKERENMLNERILPLKRAAEEKAQAERSAARSSFISMLRERGDITAESRWSKVKDSLRGDPRYKLVKHEDREAVFSEYISELKADEEKVERLSKAKQNEEEKLKERERAMRKRKEREEKEVERVRLKALRKEAVESYQALLVESIKDPQVSWTESKAKLEKDPQGRSANPHLDQADLEKLFREHVKILHERAAQDFKALLAKVITSDAGTQETEGGKTVLTSWSTAKWILKDDPRYSKMPRKDREALWRRHVEDISRKKRSGNDQGVEKNTEARRSSGDSGRYTSRSRTEERIIY